LKEKLQAPDNKHQETKSQTRAATCLAISSRLGFVVYLFGPCLRFGACDLGFAGQDGESRLQ
jgi:hypothetical protein